ncbi:unnamed protein product [Penicillium salamii]|uniref:K Homology domain-containing protein n=1 Tax=Penicillium salamii TaxID=1612424 RepID=A0A9W4JIV9_9EURO|nr:unnamed protein product [Penicillium salamii]CAG8358467.1 unnamed protein product [Penicillium salamii]CAG8394050.1 unnamed protein product [Penicillium salamii]
MADDEPRAKRSRFDQTDAEPQRPRSDRRSRSPSNRQSESARTRSPLSRPLSRGPDAEAPPKPAVSDPAAAAAAAAAKINAQLQAKKGIQHVDVPPIRSIDGPADNVEGAPSTAEGSAKLNAEVYVADGDYIKDIEINDLRNRYTLTKGSTQKMDETGADVTTRGNYYPDKNMATAANPPLYLHVTSTNKDGLEKAVDMINGLIKKELPVLVDERRFRNNKREPEQQVERDEYGRRKWPDERIPIDLEPVPGFNLRAQVVGQGGAYVKHIQQQTRCRVQIKGRGSGFIESSTNRESDEPMYLHVAGPDANDVQQAKELCEDLLNNVKEQYQKFKENPPHHHYGGYGNRSGDRGDRYQGSGYGGYNNRQQQHQNNGSSASPSGQASPGAAGAQAANDYSAQYAQYYGTADPYAAYGGYQNYVAYYQYYYAAQQQQAEGTAAPVAPASEAAPPPPGSGSPAPPPPGGGSYGAVPPPPGM